MASTMTAGCRRICSLSAVTSASIAVSYGVMRGTDLGSCQSLGTAIHGRPHASSTHAILPSENLAAACKASSSSPSGPIARTSANGVDSPSLQEENRRQFVVAATPSVLKSSTVPHMPSMTAQMFCVRRECTAKSIQPARSALLTCGAYCSTIARMSASLGPIFSCTHPCTPRQSASPSSSESYSESKVLFPVR